MLLFQIKHWCYIEFRPRAGISKRLPFVVFHHYSKLHLRTLFSLWDKNGWVSEAICQSLGCQRISSAVIHIVVIICPKCRCFRSSPPLKLGTFLTTNQIQARTSCLWGPEWLAGWSSISSLTRLGCMAWRPSCPRWNAFTWCCRAHTGHCFHYSSIWTGMRSEKRDNTPFPLLELQQRIQNKWI